ncbi:MAG: class I SAM-dependent methyltransferase [Kiloniellales bacterium]|nr:class I SAM-dependent methyltransferase [Kiloniellales bacterium]
MDKSFKQLEYEGWTARATTFDDHFAEITGAAIDPILDGLGPLDGRRLLDVGCGTGHLAAAAGRRGAEVLGVDFAETMVARARSNYPGVAFRQGDAEALDFGDAGFDAVACSFALLHLSDPEAAVAEALRVLRPGGRYAFTVWRGPEDGCEFFALTRGAIEAQGCSDVGLPSGPPADRLADPAVASAILTAAGFVEPDFQDLPLVWRDRSARAVLEAVYKGGVRTAMVLRAQTADARARIEAAILEAAESHREGDLIELAMPAVLATARKP